VYVVEKSGYPNSCFDVSVDLMTDDCSYGIATVGPLLKQFGLAHQWCYVDARGRYHGLSRREIEAVLSTADLLVDMGTHGVESEGTWLDEAAHAGLRVLVGTEPGTTQMRMEARLAAGGQLPRYDVYYTTGLNIGTVYSTVPAVGREWRPILDPVVVGLFDYEPVRTGAPFTTVMNWRSHDPFTAHGITYGQKDIEFAKFIDLPRRTRVPLEVAVAGRDVPTHALEAAGWRVRPAPEVTLTVEAYQDYIRGSMGEFSVAKHACVATNVGWFSERSAAYLASGRPVVLQDTGWSRHLPCGQGLFAVRTVDEAVEAVDEIDRDPERHARWARTLALEYLDASRVLGGMLRDLGL
jgi:hypothetical protein